MTITNGQAVGYAAQMRDDKGPEGSAYLWYQIAAVAYGWGLSDVLYTSWVQANNPFDPEVLPILEEVIAKRNLAPPPDDRAFYSIDMQQDVKAALADDGAAVNFVIPLPACKGKDGKPSRPTRKDGKWQCEPYTIEVPRGIPLPGAGDLMSAKIPWGLVIAAGLFYLITKER